MNNGMGLMCDSRARKPRRAVNWPVLKEAEHFGLGVHYTRIAQTEERQTENLCVGGSIPSLGTKVPVVYIWY